MKKNKNMQFLNSFAKVHNKQIALLCILSSISSLAYIALAFFSKSVLELATSKQLQQLSLQFVWCAIPLIAILVCDSLSSCISTKTSSLFNNSLTNSTWKTLLAKDYSSVYSMHSGDIFNRITNDIDTIANNYINFLPSIFSSSIRILCGLTAIFVIDYAFGLICVACGFVIAMLVSFTRKYYKSAQKRCLTARASENSFLQESIENIDSVKTLPRKDALTNLLDSYLKENNSAKINRNAILVAVNAIVFLAFNISFYCAIIFGAFRLVENVEYIGSLFALVQLLQLIKSPFGSIINVIPNLISLFASVERVKLLYDLPQEKNNVCDCDKFKKLQLDNISFNYGETNLLNNISFGVTAGEKIAVVGASGKGKSTLAKILVGLLSPADGKIKYTAADGQTFDFLPQNVIAYAPQNNFIFSGSIRDNLLLANPSATQTQLERACAVACVDEFVDALELKLDTQIGEKGYGLSQGQIQRVSLARALVADKDILILDEVTSSLDKSTEKKVWDNLFSLDNKTIIFITHATQFTASCDKIINIEQYNAKTSQVN
ncbi:MAG: ABC transporter ATP-binding protein [Clostridia bacterium]